MADRKRATEDPATSSHESIVPGDYADFLAGIKQQIRQRQYRALRAVNHELVALYWELGESICRKQEEHGWGRSVVENLARDLQAEFPGRNGFSPQNIWLMRQFYLEYHDKSILAPLVREISWAKNRVILGRCKDDLAREFYLRAAARFGWTKAVLQHQIDNQSYEKYLLGQTNFDQTVPESVKGHAMLAVKDRYTFDFLELAEEHSERDLEQALVRNLRQFLTEMGGAFTFVGNQYRLEGENPPIGIIICRSKENTVVEYALRTAARPLGVATYTVVPQLPEDYRADLPSPEQIVERLKAWDTQD